MPEDTLRTHTPLSTYFTATAPLGCSKHIYHPLFLEGGTPTWHSHRSEDIIPLCTFGCLCYAVSLVLGMTTSHLPDRLLAPSILVNHLS